MLAVARADWRLVLLDNGRIVADSGAPEASPEPPEPPEPVDVPISAPVPVPVSEPVPEPVGAAATIPNAADVVPFPVVAAGGSPE